MLSSKVMMLWILAAALLISGCAARQRADFTKFREANPRSILVVPAVNRAVEVNAPDYFLSTISKPVAERGFYVFPVNVVKRLLEDDGLANANLVHDADPKHLGKIFDADAILYVTIERWDAKYVVLATQVTVEFTYVLKSSRTGEELWRRTAKMVYQPQTNSSGNALADLIVMATQAAITKAAPNYIPLAQQANALAVIAPGEGLPAGPYRKDYLKDHDKF